MSPRGRRLARGAAGALAVFLILRLGAAVMSTPPKFSKFAPCPGSPNCVISRGGDASHAVAPLPFSGSPEEARAALVRVLEGMPRTRIVSSEPLYLHAECRSLVFRFVDDLELLIDPGASVVHVRSASRVGHSDLGVNRRRVEALRAAFEAALAPPR